MLRGGDKLSPHLSRAKEPGLGGKHLGAVVVEYICASRLIRTGASKVMWGLRRLFKKEDPGRSERLLTDARLHYRKVGEFAWNVGRMVNISRSGVLFHAGKMVKVNTPVEMQFVQPAVLGGKAEDLVHCRAKIVRTILPQASDSRPAFAAKFSKYHVFQEENEW